MLPPAAEPWEAAMEARRCARASRSPETRLCMAMAVPMMQHLQHTPGGTRPRHRARGCHDGEHRQGDWCQERSIAATLVGWRAKLVPRVSGGSRLQPVSGNRQVTQFECSPHPALRKHQLQPSLHQHPDSDAFSSGNGLRFLQKGVGDFHSGLHMVTHTIVYGYPYQMLWNA